MGVKNLPVNVPSNPIELTLKLINELMDAKSHDVTNVGVVETTKQLMRGGGSGLPARTIWVRELRDIP